MGCSMSSLDLGSCDRVKVFRNDGRGGFEEVTRQWGLDNQLEDSTSITPTTTATVGSIC